MKWLSVISDATPNGLGNVVCPLWPPRHHMSRNTAHSKEVKGQVVPRSGLAMAASSIWKDCGPGHAFWSTWDSPWLFQMWKASLWSQWMALHISPLQGNISRTQQGLDQLLPLSVESCLSKCLALLAQGNTEFFCFRLKKPTSFNSFNLDSCTNSKEALERLHDYTEKGKMLKERLLTKSWIKKTSPGCPGCWERLPHTVSSFMLGSNTSWAWHQMQILVWGQSTNIQIHSWNVSQKYCFSKPCFSSSWCPCSAFWWAVSPSRVSHSECTAPRHWALTQELTGRELLMPGWWKL